MFVLYICSNFMKNNLGKLYFIFEFSNIILFLKTIKNNFEELQNRFSLLVFLDVIYVIGTRGTSLVAFHYFCSMWLYKLSMEKPLGRSQYLGNDGKILIHFEYATTQDKGPDAHIDVQYYDQCYNLLSLFRSSKT